MQKPLLFIDTNIFLDFYRDRGSDLRIELLKQIEDNFESLIFTDQVYMEFRKNRQKVIRDSLSTYKLKVQGDTVPSILKDTKTAELLARSTKEAKSHNNKIQKRIESLIANPMRNDDLYKSIRRISKKKWRFNLKKEALGNKRELLDEMLQRFQLGYPPRKGDDTAFGDTLNWLYILHSAKTEQKDIVIVSRDGDFGFHSKGKSYLNDFLREEFRDIVGARKSVELTNKLSFALKRIKVKVSSKVEEQETKFLDEVRDPFSLPANAQKIHFPWLQDSDPFKSIQEVSRQYIQVSEQFKDLFRLRPRSNNDYSRG